MPSVTAGVVTIGEDHMTEAAVSPAAGAIPQLITDLTPEWLTAAIGQRIDDVEIESIGEGIGLVGQLARLHLRGDDGVPTTVIAKMHSLHAENQGIAMHYGLYTTEAGFYTDCAHQLGVRVPRSYHAAASPDGSMCVLLLEDMAGAVALDQIAGCPIDRAEQVVDDLATLHSRWWENPELDEMPWLRPVNNDAYKSITGHYGMGLDVVRAEYGDVLPPAALECAAHYGEIVADLYDWTFHHRPMTLAHTDLRLDNLFFDHPDGSDLVMIDWQLTVRSLGAFDLSYFLCESLTTDDRREHEERLVRRYHAGLLAGGVTGYTFDDLWFDYRVSMATQFSITVVSALMDLGNERGRDLADTMIRRQFTAVADHDVLPLLRELPL